MELQTAIEILEYHQEWRLGKREDMIHEPKKLTEALDIVLSEVKKFRLDAVSGSDLVKSDWSLRECFKQLRFDKNHHLGLGDIRLTIAQQEEICDLVERFYHCR